jgi:hypothetical protein
VCFGFQELPEAAVLVVQGAVGVYCRSTHACALGKRNPTGMEWR